MVTNKTKNSLKRKLVNFFGAIGYFFSSLQWLWAFLLYSSLIIGLAKFMSHGTNSQISKTTPAVDLGASAPMIIVTVIITFVMAVLTVYILIKIPSTLIKASKKVVQGAAENATPLVLHAQNKKDTKRNHIKLTPILILITKIILIITPVVLSFMSQFIEKQAFAFNISMFVSLWLAGFSLIFFIVQYLIAGLLSVKKQDLW